MCRGTVLESRTRLKSPGYKKKYEVSLESFSYTSKESKGIDIEIGLTLYGVSCGRSSFRVNNTQDGKCLVSKDKYILTGFLESDTVVFLHGEGAQDIISWNIKVKVKDVTDNTDGIRNILAVLTLAFFGYIALRSL